MNQQLNNSENQPAALETKEAKTMRNLSRNAMTVTAFTALALFFGACSQPELTQINSQTKGPHEITDTFTQEGPDVPASAEDLAELDALESGQADIDPQAVIVVPVNDRIAPTVVQFYPRDKSQYDFSGTACPTIGFSETMKHSTIKSAFKIIVTPPGGKPYIPKGRFRWFIDAPYEPGGPAMVDTVEFCPNLELKNLSTVRWGVNRKVTDLAGNKLKTAKSWSYRVYN